MIQLISRFTCVALAVVLLTGCKDEASVRRGEARAKIDAALTTIQEAEQGFVLGDAQARPDVMAHRQKKLADAAQQLEAVLAMPDLGDDATARRTAAAAYDAIARYQAAAALTQWTDVSRRASNLMGQLVAVLDAQQRADLFQTDINTVVEKLQKQHDEIQGRIGERQQRADTLKKQVEQLQAERKKLASQRDELSAKSQELSTKAFTLTGKDRHDTYQESIKTQAQAKKADTDSQAKGALLAAASAELAIVEEQLKLDGEAAQLIARQLETVKSRQRDEQNQRNMVLNDESDPTSRKSSVAALVTQFKQVGDDYDKNVAANFDQAVGTIDKAVKHLEAAQKSAGQGHLRGIQLDLLSAQVDKTRILSNQVMAQSDMARMLGIVAQRAGELRLPDADVQTMSAKAQALSAAQKNSVNAARQTIGDAGSLSGKLSSSTSNADAVATVAAAHFGTLENYAARINASATDAGDTAQPIQLPQRQDAPAPGTAPGNSDVPANGGAGNGDDMK